MNLPPEPSRSREEIESEAAQWVLRCDRGLTAAEQDEFSSWLATNPRHRTALGEQRWGWDELDRLAGLQTTVGALPDPNLLAPRRTGRLAVFRQARAWAPIVLAAAAAVALAAWLRPAKSLAPEVATRPMEAPRTALAAPCERRTLEDGTTVELNRGAMIEVAFSASVRNVHLVRGEANFRVAKDPARPFVVNAGGVAVRAIGTVFNVQLDAAEVEVLVTEGRVMLAPSHPAARAQPDLATILEISQRAVVHLNIRERPAVATLTPAQLEARLAWQPRLLDFTDATLLEIVEEFNRRNPVRMVLADPTLAGVRLSAAFRSDNVEGFVRLMESDFGMRAEWRGEREVALWRVK